MGNDTLITRVAGDVITEDDPNIFNRVLQGDFVGRDSSGAPTAYQNLGTTLVPWGVTRITSLIIDGQVVDVESVTARPNRIVSGAERTTSEFPAYLKADGGAALLTVLGATTPLTIDVQGSLGSFTTDVVKTGLTTSSLTNRSCFINDPSLTGQDTTKNLGENGTVITVDAMESELTSRIGEFVTIFSPSTSELIYCKVESSTKLTNAKRGFFFDSSNNPIPRAVLNNNDFLVYVNTGYIFVDIDGVSVDVTYNAPITGGNEPSSPATGDYWLDETLGVWKRYSGSAFVTVNRTFAGYAVIDPTKCLAVRPEYFSKSYNDTNTLSVDYFSDDIIQSRNTQFSIAVHGKQMLFDLSFTRWIAATDFESGVTRTVSTYYWLYITENGLPIISDQKPYDTRGFFGGWYHPYESWRAVGQIYNDSSNNFSVVGDSEADLIYLEGFSLPSQITLTNSGSYGISFGAGTFEFSDKSGSAVAPAYTKLLNAAWAAGDNVGGLDTGALANNTWYYCHAIHNLTTKESDFIFSLSDSAPTLPAGYTKSSYLGAVRSDTTAIKPSTWEFIGDGVQKVTYATGVTDLNTPTPPTVTTNLPLTLPARKVFWDASVSCGALAALATVVIDNDDTVNIPAISTTYPSGVSFQVQTKDDGSINYYNSAVVPTGFTTQGYVDYLKR